MSLGVILVLLIVIVTAGLIYASTRLGHLLVAEPRARQKSGHILRAKEGLPRKPTPKVAGDERRPVAPWAGALITFVLGAVSGTGVPWAAVIFFVVLPQAGSFLGFVFILMPLLAFVSMTGALAVLSAQYASKSGTSPLWAVAGGIAGIALQVYVLSEIIRNISNQD